LPVVHIVAIIVAACAWQTLRADIAAADAQLGFRTTNTPNISLPSVALLVVASGAVLAIAIALKRRHGEWAHAAVMLALSFLLLLGMWLPILSRLCVSTPSPFTAAQALDASNFDHYGGRWYWGWEYNRRLFDRATF